MKVSLFLSEHNRLKYHSLTFTVSETQRNDIFYQSWSIKLMCYTDSDGSFKD